ncbi:MAG: hypothetical protein ACRER7_08425 [Gammaproteobacteria bacterium]
MQTRHSVTINGASINYTATAGTLLLYAAKHQPTASVFYIAYTKDSADANHRPLTFAYNGGPGFASTLVDIGGFGPERIVWATPRPRSYPSGSQHGYVHRAGCEQQPLTACPINAARMHRCCLLHSSTPAARKLAWR